MNPELYMPFVDEGDGVNFHQLPNSNGSLKGLFTRSLFLPFSLSLSLSDIMEANQALMCAEEEVQGPLVASSAIRFLQYMGIRLFI